MKAFGRLPKLCSALMREFEERVNEYGYSLQDPTRVLRTDKLNRFFYVPQRSSQP